MTRAVPAERRCWGLLAVLLAATLVAGCATGHAPQATELPPIRLDASDGMPNGIAIDDDGTVFVGTLTGRVLRLAPDGEIRDIVGAASPLASVTSLRFDPSGTLLHGTAPDLSRLLGSGDATAPPVHRTFLLDPRTGRLIWQSAVPDGGFGNDMAIDDDGVVFLTDSAWPRILSSDDRGRTFRPLVVDQRFAGNDIGLAGIAHLAEGDLVVGTFRAGSLFRIRMAAESAAVVPLKLSRTLENPDGMVAVPGGVLVVEGGIASGDGRLSYVRLPPRTNETAEVTTLASGLRTPVNIAVHRGVAYVTEANIGHLLRREAGAVAPEDYLVRRYSLQFDHTEENTP